METDRLDFFLPGSLRVKFCGITNAEDAANAVAHGAHAIGVNFFENSKRFVPIESAIPWLAAVPVARIAVVVNPETDLMESIVESGVIDAVQFHGDERPDACAACPLPWIRAVRVESRASLDAALTYRTEFLLLDAYSAQGYGGTGHRLNWEMAAEFVQAYPDRRVVIAGGLTPETVGRAVGAIRPHGVDVASGIELPANPRKKIATLMEAFFKNAVAADGRKSVV